MTREQLMADFEQAFSVQFDSGNFSKAKDTYPNMPVQYTDHTTFWAFLAWISAYETYGVK